jgi:hypothetical protein
MIDKYRKYTVITGASSGIGYETAKAFAARGKNLIVTARCRDQVERSQAPAFGMNPGVEGFIDSQKEI